MIYVASSWRNPRQPEVVEILRREGYNVYDFKNPGFRWSDIDLNWQEWDMQTYRDMLNHPIAVRGYKSDFTAMLEASIFVGVMPFGRSASMEMGWAAGQGKQTILLLSDGEPELMVKMFDHICVTMDEVLAAITAFY